MEPRSYFATCCMCFAVTAIPFALLMSLMSGDGMETWLPGGLLFGVLFGLVMGHLLKGQKVSVAIDDTKAFATNLKLALAGMGFHPETGATDFLTFKPSFQAGLLSGRISVALEEGSATIVGPKMYVTKLLKRLGLSATSEARGVAAGARRT